MWPAVSDLLSPHVLRKMAADGLSSSIVCLDGGTGRQILWLQQSLASLARTGCGGIHILCCKSFYDRGVVSGVDVVRWHPAALLPPRR
jgi:hypothetical protein